MTETKRCRGCGKTKPVTEYHKNNMSPDGLRPRCKDCTNAALRRRYRMDWAYRERKIAICKDYWRRKNDRES